MAKTFRQMVREARGKIKVIGPREAKPIIDLGAAMLIDVREAWERREGLLDFRSMRILQPPFDRRTLSS